MKEDHKIGFAKRISLAVKQPRGSLVIRRAKGVYLHPLDPSIQKFEEYRRFTDLHIYASLSAASYADTNASHNTHFETANKYGWRKILDETGDENLPVSSKKISGLRYQGWYNEHKKLLAITFRGSGKRLGDWYSNFRWVTKFIPGIDDHYDLVNQHIGTIVNRARAACGPVDSITTCGHSLGGGLAQHAAYSHASINTAYAFNPTPVTGYKSIEKTARAENSKNVFIARVFEHGEVLAYLRLGLRNFYAISEKNPEIVELRFNFQSKIGGLREHGMSSFAKHVCNTVAGAQTI